MTQEYKPHIVVIIPRADTSRELSVEPCTELSVPRASSAERVLLVPEPGKPVVASFALEIPLVIRPLGACCNSRSLKSGRKRKKRPTHEKPISTPSTADGHSMAWASTMACKGHGRAQACYRHRQTSHARAGVPNTPPCTVGVVGRRKKVWFSLTGGPGREVPEEFMQKDCS